MPFAKKKFEIWMQDPVAVGSVYCYQTSSVSISDSPFSSDAFLSLAVQKYRNGLQALKITMMTVNCSTSARKGL